MESASMSDPLDVAPTTLMRAGSLVMVVGGLLRLSTGLQLLLLVRLGGQWWWVPYAMSILGAALFVVGAQAGRGRLGAAWGAAVLAPLLGVLGAVWDLFALSRGLFSLLSVVSTGVCLLAALLAVLSLPASLRVAEARRKLLS